MAELLFNLFIVIIAMGTGGAMALFFLNINRNRGVFKFWNPPKDVCPNCGLPFSDWFFWPGIGDYCWPCYNKTGEIFTKEQCNGND